MYKKWNREIYISHLKESLKIIGAVLGIIVIFYFIAGFAGIIDLKFYKYFGTQQASIQRDIFKENKSYIEGMSSDLAKYRFELQTEKDDTSKKAIIDLIRSKYADFDINNLKDTGLQSFLRDIRNGIYN